jgi:hypothetical protein
LVSARRRPEQLGIDQIAIDRLRSEMVAQRIPVPIVGVVDPAASGRCLDRAVDVDVMAQGARQPLAQPQRQTFVGQPMRDQHEFGAIGLRCPAERQDVLEMIRERSKHPRVLPDVDIPQREFILRPKQRS